MRPPARFEVAIEKFLTNATALLWQHWSWLKLIKATVLIGWDHLDLIFCGFIANKWTPPPPPTEFWSQTSDLCTVAQHFYIITLLWVAMHLVLCKVYGGRRHFLVCYEDLLQKSLQYCRQNQYRSIWLYASRLHKRDHRRRWYIYVHAFYSKQDEKIHRKRINVVN